MSWNPPMWQLPIRDPLSYDGVREPGHLPLPKVRMHAHTHCCPDGSPVRCLSQWITAVEATLDRWEVGGYIIATSSRRTRPELAPDFGWLDVLSLRAA